MDVSIDGTINAALALQAANLQQQKNMAMLRQTLDIQAATVTEILQAMPTPAPQGSLGHHVNTYV